MTTAVAVTTATPAQPAAVSPTKHTGQNRRLRIGHRLRDYRTRAGLTQEALADLTREIDQREHGPDAMGITKYTITRQENERRRPKPHTARLLAAALSQALGETINISDLTRGDDPAATLYGYLEGERARRALSETAFYARWLGIPNSQLDLLRNGRPLPADRYGKIATELPETGSLIMDCITSLAQPEARKGAQ